MKRTILPLLLFLLIPCASGLFASGSGESRLGLGLGFPNAVLVYRTAPFEFKGGYDFTEGNEFIFLSGDLLLVNARPIADPLRLSLGIGAYGKLFLESEGEDSTLEGGARLPLGLSVRTRDEFLEFFVQISPGLDFYPRFSISDQPVQFWAGITLQLD